MFQVNSNSSSILKILITGSIFYIAGQLAMPLAVPPSYAGAIWPPAGIGLAAVLLWGYRVLPGIILAELLINFHTFDTVLLASSVESLLLFILIGFNSGVRSALGAYMIRKVSCFPNPLVSPKPIALFVILGGPCATLIPALVSIYTLYIIGIIPEASFLTSFLIWWLGDSIGVAIFAPLFFMLADRSFDVWKTRRLTVGLPLIVTLVFAVIICKIAQKREEIRLSNVFFDQAKMLSHELGNRINNQIEILYVTRSFINGSEAISPEKFRVFSERYFQRHKELMSLRWITPQHAVMARGEAVDRQVNDFSQYAVKYAAPVLTIENRSDFDPGSNPDLLEVLEDAFERDQVRSTYTEQNLGLPGTPAIYTLYLPVSYSLTGSPPIGGSQKLVFGFLAAVFDLDEIIKQEFVDDKQSNLMLEIREKIPNAEAKVIYRTDSGINEAGVSQYSEVSMIENSGRLWEVVVTSTASFVGQNYSWTVWIVSAAGMLFTSLLTICLLVLTGQAAAIRRQVRNRTNELELANNKLARSEAQFRELVQAQSGIVWRTDARTMQFTFVSDEAEKILGYPIQDWLKQDFWINHLHEDDKVWAWDYCMKQSKKIVKYEFEYRMMAADGRTVWLRDIVNFIVERGMLKELVGYLIDITEQKNSEQELRLAATTFESLQGILITDKDSKILRVNQAFTDITGYTPDDVIGQNPKIFQSGRHDTLFYQELWRQLTATGQYEGEIWNRKKNGDIFPEWVSITAVNDDAGETSHYVATYSDITEKKEAESVIHNLAFYDPLTGLPNRRLLMDRLEQEISAAHRYNKFGAVIYLDLDQFKVLNDSLGHHVGDQLLIQVSERLSEELRESDTACRLGGDEFVILLQVYGLTAGQMADEALVVAEKIKHSISLPYRLIDQEHHFTTSIGITIFSEKYCSPDEIIQQADTAMYRSKASGRNTISFYHHSMQKAADARLYIEKELRKAIEQEQFELFYQPQIDGDGFVCSAEALIRWNHHDKGVVPPAEFVPIAEEIGLIIPIGKWVLREACRQYRIWLDMGLGLSHIAVNVSSRQFRQADFVDQVNKIICDSGIQPEHLVIELTERVMVNDIKDTIEKMRLLKEMGVRISVDDFGTGYSSLLYLKQLPLDQLKVDQSFIRDIATDSNDAVIVQTIIDMARNLGLSVIAEGVENETQVRFLKDNGCSIFQGYYFGKPLPTEEFIEQIKRQKKPIIMP